MVKRAGTPPVDLEHLKAARGRLFGTSRKCVLERDEFAEHARWIAIVISTWQAIEDQLSFQYSFLLGLKGRAGLIAWHSLQNHRARILAISSALHEFVPDSVVLKTWKELQPDIKKAKHLRDSFAHAQWAANPKKNHVLEMRSTYVEERFITKAVLYPLNNIKANAAQVSGIAGDVGQLSVALVEFVAPHGGQ